MTFRKKTNELSHIICVSLGTGFLWRIYSCNNLHSIWKMITLKNDSADQVSFAYTERTAVFISTLPFQYLAYSDLPGTEYQWVPGDARFIPVGAVIGGTSSDGYPLYVIQGKQPGNYDPRNTSAEVEYSGSYTVNDWMWLVLIYSTYARKKIQVNSLEAVSMEACCLIWPTRHICISTIPFI